MTISTLTYTGAPLRQRGDAARIGGPKKERIYITMVMCTYIYIYIYTLVYVYTYVYIYIYIYMQHIKGMLLM